MQWTFLHYYSSKNNKFWNIPRQRCKKLLMPDRRANVTKSPRLAAIGVAMLSGLILNRRDNKMMNTMSDPKMRLATVAVTRLLAQSNVAWLMSKWPSTIQPMVTAAVAANIATTIAWTWKQAQIDYWMLVYVHYQRFCDQNTINKLSFKDILIKNESLKEFYTITHIDESIVRSQKLW